MKYLRKKERGVRLPAWILPLFMAPFCEILLHLWTVEEFVAGRFAAVVVFGMGLGALLAFLSSLLPGKASKWAAGILSFLLVVVYVAELLMHNVFQNYMAMDTIQAGAAGVANNYMRIVVEEIITHLPHIFLMLAPIILFIIFLRPVKFNWKPCVALVLVTVLLYGAAVSVVYAVGIDVSRLSTTYNFDTAVDSFGLTTAFVLDLFNDPEVVGEDLEFITVETTAPTTAPTEPTETTDVTEETTEEVTEPPVVYYEQTLGLDFAELAANETNSNVATLHSYVASQPVMMTNDYTGLFAGKNLIFLSAEAFCGPAFISEELTPTLYRLMTEGIYFSEYYQPVWGAGTTGGEYTNLVGLVPNGGSCMKETQQQKLFLTMGNQLQQLGYSSAAFHNNDYTYYDRHETHTLLGYDYFMGYGNGMEEGITKQWPQSDLEMIDFTVPMYIDKQPFNVYYMTVSGHSSYDQSNAMGKKNFSLVEDLGGSKSVRYYIATQMELEAALTSLLRQLEEAGIMDDTVIVVASDHYPYGLVSDTKSYIGELMDVPYVNDFTRDRNTLIIWSGCIEDMDIVVDTPVSSLDILPTLSNLFGVPYDSRLLVGRDVFSDADPLVFWGVSGSWKTDKGSYLASSGKFQPNEGVEVDDEYVSRITAIVQNKIKYCRAVASYNYYTYVWDALQALNPPESTEETTEETVEEITEETVEETTAETESVETTEAAQ